MTIRVLLSLLTVLYSEERYIGVEAADTMQMMIIYRSERRASWPTAHRTCMDKFGEMFNPKTKTLQAVLEAAIDLDKNLDVWIGLTNQGGSNPDWRWSDCEPLDPATDWSAEEPNNRMCVAADRMSGKFRTESCAEESLSFVCSNTEGNCNYEVHDNSVCETETGEIAVRKIMGELETPSQCQEACSRETEGGKVCWGAEWDSGEVCTLIFSYNPFVCEATRYQMHITLFVRKCFMFEIKSDLETTNADSNPPSLGCAAPTTTTSTSNPDVQTPLPFYISASEPSESVYQPTVGVTNQNSLLTVDVIQTFADAKSGEVRSTGLTVSSSSLIGPTASLTAVTNTSASSLYDDSSFPTTPSSHSSTSDDGSTGCRCICVVDLSSMTGPLDITQLQLNKKNLSSWRRKLDSAVDNRPSAQSLGASGIALLVLMFGFIIMLDANRLFKQ